MVDDDRASLRLRRLEERNLLVHLYLDVDDGKVFESLSHLDAMRQFAAFVEEQLD